MIDLFYWPTPNGRKVTILLEEAEIAYNLIPLNIGLGDQFKPEYLKLNPNHRMPTIVDHAPKGGGAPIGVFESGAIMMYLANKHGLENLYPKNPERRALIDSANFYMTGTLYPLVSRSVYPRLGFPSYPGTRAIAMHVHPFRAHHAQALQHSAGVLRPVEKQEQNGHLAMVVHDDFRRAR